MGKPKPHYTNKYLEAKRLGKPKPPVPKQPKPLPREVVYKQAYTKLASDLKTLDPSEQLREKGKLQNALHEQKLRLSRQQESGEIARQLFEKNRAHLQIKMSRTQAAITHCEKMLELFPKTYICPNCGKSLKNKAGLTSHLKTCGEQTG